MRRLAVLMVFMLFPVVAALPTFTDNKPFPEDPRIESTVTKTQVFSDAKVIHWERGVCWPTFYFYPYGEDIDARYGSGVWRHIETHEEGLSFNITLNRYINWSGPIDDSLTTPFYMDSFKFSWSTHALISYNVTEGHDGSISSNATVSEAGLEDGVSVQFEFVELDEQYIYCELITVINITVTFVSTWEYWEWVCGGVQDSSEVGAPIQLLVLIGSILFVGWQADKWDKREKDDFKSKIPKLSREERNER